MNKKNNTNTNIAKKILQHSIICTLIGLSMISVCCTPSNTTTIINTISTIKDHVSANTTTVSNASIETLDTLEGLTANISGMKQLGIKKLSAEVEPESGNESESEEETPEEEILPRYVLVGSTEEITADDPIIENNQLIEITFTKTITNISRDVNGVDPDDQIEITQEELSSEIDKLYVGTKFTFMSFVPMGMSQRHSLGMNDDGIDLYDLCDYYSDNTRQSYLINNTTGKIYSIKEHIYNIYNGLVQIQSNSNSYYDFVLENDELKIIPVIQNPNVIVYDIWKDKYGFYYIWNDKIDRIDTEKHFVFVKEKNCNTSSVSNIPFMTNTHEMILGHWDGNAYDSFKLMQEDFTMRDLTTTDIFDQLKIPNRFLEDGFVNEHPYKIENGLIYLTNQHKHYQSGYNVFTTLFATIDIITGVYQQKDIYPFDLHNYAINSCFMHSDDILLVYSNNSIIAYYNIIDHCSGGEKEVLSEIIGEDLVLINNRTIQTFDVLSTTNYNYHIENGIITLIGSTENYEPIELILQSLN